MQNADLGKLKQLDGSKVYYVLSFDNEESIIAQTLHNSGGSNNNNNHNSDTHINDQHTNRIQTHIKQYGFTFGSKSRQALLKPTTLRSILNLNINNQTLVYDYKKSISTVYWACVCNDAFFDRRFLQMHSIKPITASNNNNNSIGSSGSRGRIRGRSRSRNKSRGRSRSRSRSRSHDRNYSKHYRHGSGSNRHRYDSRSRDYDRRNRYNNNDRYTGNNRNKGK